MTDDPIKLFTAEELGPVINEELDPNYLYEVIADPDNEELIIVPHPKPH